MDMGVMDTVVGDQDPGTEAVGSTDLEGPLAETTTTNEDLSTIVIIMKMIPTSVLNTIKIHCRVSSWLLKWDFGRPILWCNYPKGRISACKVFSWHVYYFITTYLLIIVSGSAA